MTRQIYLLIIGYLRLKVTGRRLEKLINVLMRQGFEIWEINRVGDIFYFNVKANQFNELSLYIKNSGCQMEVEKRRGISFLGKRLINRKGLIVGVIILIGSDYICSSFLWFIEIEGMDKIEREEII